MLQKCVRRDSEFQAEQERATSIDLSISIQKYSDVFRCRVREPTKNVLVFNSPVLQRGVGDLGHNFPSPGPPCPSADGHSGPGRREEHNDKSPRAEARGQ